MADSPQVAPSLLRSIGLFGALDDGVLHFLSEQLMLVHLSAGEVVFREGDSARELYVLLSGELEVLKRTPERGDAVVALLGPGDWFGEMSLLDVQPRSATVRVLAPARLLRITAGDLDALYRRDLRAYTLLILNLARELSRRLRAADNVIVQLGGTLQSYLESAGRPRLPRE